MSTGASSVSGSQVSISRLLKQSGVSKQELAKFKEIFSIAMKSNPQGLSEFITEECLPDDLRLELEEEGQVQFAYKHFLSDEQKASIEGRKNCVIKTAIFVSVLVVALFIVGILTMTKSMDPTMAGLVLTATTGVILLTAGFVAYRTYQYYNSLNQEVAKSMNGRLTASTQSERDAI